MKQSWIGIEEKREAFALARYGALGLALRPVLKRGFDQLSARITPKAAAVVLGLLFVVFAWSGARDVAHREEIVESGRYETQKTGAHAWRYDIRRVYRSGLGYDSHGERHGYYVGFGDWAEHRFWSTLRKVSGWSFLLSAVIGLLALRRRCQRESWAATFGSDSAEYAELTREPSFEELDREDLRNDWLLSGVPGTEGRDHDDALPPRFGRRPA